MLLNCSNHPSADWGEPLINAANERYGEIIDLPYPRIDPEMPIDELRPLVDEYAEKIESYRADAVMAAGEFTFLFMLVDRLLQDGVNVVCTCSRRKTKEILLPDGSNEKISIFQFEQFRPYAYYNAEKNREKPEEETHV